MTSTPQYDGVENLGMDAFISREMGEGDNLLVSDSLSTNNGEDGLGAGVDVGISRNLGGDEGLRGGDIVLPEIRSKRVWMRLGKEETTYG